MWRQQQQQAFSIGVYDIAVDGDAEREQSIFNDVFTAQGFAPRRLWKLLQDVSAELLPLHQ